MASIPQTMRAMRLHALGAIVDDREPLQLEHIPVPSPGTGEVLVRITACGVCHTELDEIEARTAPPSLPVTPGHQVTGRVIAEGRGCDRGLLDRDIGIAWVSGACGSCKYCEGGFENLCPDFVATGRDRDGGYAEFIALDERFVHPLPDTLDPVLAAPLLCAGAVGHRALRLCHLRNGQALGLTGFGASGQLVIRMARYLYPDSRVAVFARNARERALAQELGASWSGDTATPAPFPLTAIIDTTPAWKPVRSALACLESGGRLVINAIRKEDADKSELLELHYETHLWQEKSIQSVANVTRDDVRACLRLASEIPLVPEVTTYPLEAANRALLELRQGGSRGAKVLLMD